MLNVVELGGLGANFVAEYFFWVPFAGTRKPVGRLIIVDIRVMQ